jgi:alkanesulfonate monooxygenase SsuD/methylene tetrahydromethanopterin reductase-like flavin-dependent oxidoreductase (luciferase family)
MRVSFTMDFRNPRREPWREYWEDRLWLMTEAAAMGFDQILVQEHFFTTDGYAPSVPVFQSLLIERTRNVRVGTYTYILPLHNAAQLAQETAVLDHFSEGRLDVCVGAGHNPAEYQAWGYSPKTRPSRMEEGLDVLKLAWRGEQFSYKGRYYDLNDVVVAPSPYQKPHPPLWVAATSPAAAARAGRHGAHLHAASVDPAVFAAYHQGLGEAGIPPLGMRASNSWCVTVTDEDPDAHWERYKDLHIERWDYYRSIRAAMGDEALNSGLPGSNPYRSHDLVGTGEVVLKTLRAFKDALPLTDIVLSNTAGGIPARGEAYRNLKAIAEQVLPVLKSW